MRQTVILGHGLVVRNLIDRPATGALKGFSHLKSTPLAARWPIAALSPGDRINYFDCDGHVNDKMQRGYRYALTAPIGHKWLSLKQKPIPEDCPESSLVGATMEPLRLPF